MYKIIAVCLCIFILTNCHSSKKIAVPATESNQGQVKLEKLPTHASTPISGAYSIVGGKIFDQNGEPIPFATILLENKDGQKFGQYTDIDGVFQLKNIPKGIYTMTISLVGYTTQIYGPMHLDQALEITFKLIEAEEIEVILLKPVIYLYPQDTTQVSVQIAYDGQLLHTYPRYGTSGWTMTAHPDGTLTDKSGRNYYALYWEGSKAFGAPLSCGTVVSANSTIPFLENALSVYGLNEREANEFIMYWLPQLEKNPYNLIHFSSQEYDNEIPLIISPQPDVIIRLMMTVVPLSCFIEFPSQILPVTTPNRKGFCVVEWGGQWQELNALNFEQP
jgi:CarboxypepD_reg-like domain